MTDDPNLRPRASADDVPRFLSREACQAIIAQAVAQGVEGERITLTSCWRGDVRWGRNRITIGSDWRENELEFGDIVRLNQLDATSLGAAMQWFNHVKISRPDATRLNPPEVVWAAMPQVYPVTPIWSASTYAQSPEVRSTVAAQIITMAEQAGLWTAGYLCVEARGTSFRTLTGQFLYAQQTLAQCSLTVRDPQGTGSGWAGVSSYDWGRVDAEQLATVAVQKCLASRNPVKLEPGRYTTILEPQAAFGLFDALLNNSTMRLVSSESLPPSPFSASGTYTYPVGHFGDIVKFGKTKLGEIVLDTRLSIRSDPMDPQLGTLPFSGEGNPYAPVTWVEHGILTTLAYERTEGQSELHEAMAKPWSGAYRVEGSGALVSREEMIATTQRGLLVTRFWDVQTVDQLSVLCTGLTRDGVWLIEHGKISKPVQNFRFTESPLFVFNNVEQIGASVPVFNPETPIVVPLIKVRDFSFTSLVDAV